MEIAIFLSGMAAIAVVAWDIYRHCGENVELMYSRMPLERLLHHRGLILAGMLMLNLGAMMIGGKL